jgi:hypothetical protein
LASTDRSTSVPYSPANPPYTDKAQDLSRATWDELYRIAERFSAIEQPAAIAVTGTEVCTIQPAEVWQRLFDGTKIYDWERPGAQLDQATGVWTCPQEGLYLFNIVIEIPPFPSPGSRLYEATLRTTGRPAAGGADRIVFSKTGSPDEATMRLVASFLRPLYRGDEIWWDLDLTEEAYTGSVTVLSILSICRQANIR